MHPAGKVAALSFEGRVISNLQSANIEFTMKRLVSRSLRAKPDYETEIPKAREEFKNYRVLLAKKARTTERPQEGKFQWSRDR